MHVTGDLLSWHILLDICDHYGIPYNKPEKLDAITVHLYCSAYV